jgi:hypothetical protein
MNMEMMTRTSDTNSMRRRSTLHNGEKYCIYDEDGEAMRISHDDFILLREII